MTINYICNGFDKDFYNFDAVVVEVIENKVINKLGCYTCKPCEDFSDDYDEVLQKLPVNTFESNMVTAARSERTGIYYIFVLTWYKSGKRATFQKSCNRCRECLEEIVKCISELDVKNVLIPSVFNNCYDKSIKDKDDFFVNILRNSIDRFSQKNIYIMVNAIHPNKLLLQTISRNIENGVMTPEEGRRIYVKSQMDQSTSYINSLLRTAEIETKYKPKTIAEQFSEDMNNDAWFFYEYIDRYQGTDTALAIKANINNSTISRIRHHDYESRSRIVVISLAIALDLTVEDRKRFINSAGFSYPNTEHDRFIEQQLRKKRYTSVQEFNEDVFKINPKLMIKSKFFRNAEK